MAAAQVRNWLNNTLGITDPDVRQEVTDQGLDSFATMWRFNKNRVKSLIYAIRKPGGMVANP